LIVIASTLLAAPAAAQPTPKPTEEPANRIVALDPRWTVTFDTAPAAPAGFDEQLAYVPLKGGELQAIDLNRGSVQWKAALTTAMTPATGDGLVFTIGDGRITALEQRRGDIVWTAPIEGTVSAPLYWDTGWLIVSTEAGELVAFRAQDGQIMWRQPLGSPLAAAPTPGGDRLYVALKDGKLVALTLATGAIVWTTPLDEEITGILGLDEQIVAGTRGNRVYSIAIGNGRIRWSQRVGADIAGAPVADEKSIYFASFDNMIRALDRHRGSVRWSHKLPTRPAAGPLRIRNVVLQPYVTNDIGAFLATTGADAFMIKAVGEMAGIPFLREAARPTEPLLIAISREGALQGFAPRVEPPPTALAVLPGIKTAGN